MSTISNSRASRRRGVACLVVSLLAGVGAFPAPAQAERRRVAPEAPRAAAAVLAEPSTGTGEPRTVPRPVALRAVNARRVDRHEAAERMGLSFAKSARDPLAIEVETAAPLGNLARSSSPVIVLNGTVLAETIPRPPNRLVAYLPDTVRLREVNQVEVFWLGDETRTRSPRPLTFRADELR